MCTVVNNQRRGVLTDTELVAAPFAHLKILVNGTNILTGFLQTPFADTNILTDGTHILADSTRSKTQTFLKMHFTR